MLSRAVLAIGLLFCASQSNSYILLSANIEDIRKVATKFLSDDVVEKLIGLISKLHKSATINLSEENKVNEKSINTISEDEMETGLKNGATTPGIVRSGPKKITKRVHKQLREDRENYNSNNNKYKQKRYKNADEPKAGDLYGKNQGVMNEDRVVATSGRLKLPRINDGRTIKYDWERSD